MIKGELTAKKSAYYGRSLAAGMDHAHSGAPLWNSSWHNAMGALGSSGRVSAYFTASSREPRL